MKTLLIDIETSPTIADVWALFNQNVGINQIRENTRVICFAAKWYGKPKVSFYSEFNHGREAMVQAAYDLLDEADVVVGYNSKSFDVKHLRREFLLAGMTPHAPVQHVDLYQAIKTNFRFVSNKLDHISQQLEIGSKVKHAGHGLWVRCMAGEAKAWKEMEKYNKQDVVLLEPLYDRIRPWMTNHPNLALYNGTINTCTHCEGSNLVKRGFRHTTISKFQRYRCSDCGAWINSGISEARSDLRPTV